MDGDGLAFHIIHGALRLELVATKPIHASFSIRSVSKDFFFVFQLVSSYLHDFSKSGAIHNLGQALDGAHLTLTPVAKCSLMRRARRSVLNSWHAGGAVWLIRSYKLLQSVATRESDFPITRSFNKFSLSD